MSEVIKCKRCGFEDERIPGHHRHIWKRMRCQSWAKFKNPIFLFYCTQCPALKAREVRLVETDKGREVHSNAYYLQFDKWEKMEGSDMPVSLFSREQSDDCRVAEVDIIAPGKKVDSWKQLGIRKECKPKPKLSR